MPLIDPRQLLQRRAVSLPSAASFFVPGLPDLHDDPSSSSSNASNASTPHPLHMSAGYLPARPPRRGSSDSTPADDANLYFLLLRARHTPPKRKLIIWFNGGPGCSSFDGAMMEIGAWRMDGNGGLVWAQDGGSWNEYADVLFLDQPVGTGFSYVNTNAYATSLPQAALEVVYFLKQFVQVFPEYARDIEQKYGKSGSGVDVYLAGESFAGQYIPYTADALIKAGINSPVSLKGIAIGNGFIDPDSQYGTELETMVAKKLWSPSSSQYQAVHKIVRACRKELDKSKGRGGVRDNDTCDQILRTIIDETTKILSTNVHSVDDRKCINIYDVRLIDSAPACGMNWPTTLAATYTYLARGDVRKALHVDDRHKPEAWVECNNNVGSAMRTDTVSSPSVTLLPAILESGVKVMLFAGEEDLICNAIGVKRTADNLIWGGKKGFGNAPIMDWTVNGKLAGSWQTSRNLTYVGIRGASHMVGVDMPVESNDMILRFMEVDYLKVAGPNAMVPSRVGDEPDRVLITGGGGGFVHVGQDGTRVIPGTGKTEEQVAEEARWRAYYNAGSVALVVMLIAVGLGTWLLLRLRRKAREDKARLGRGGALRLGSQSGGDEAHELERLVDGQEDGAKSRPSIEERDAETIYHVGESESEDEDEDGHGDGDGDGDENASKREHGKARA